MAITNNVGSLKIQITNNNFFPVEGASVYISPTSPGFRYSPVRTGSRT